MESGEDQDGDDPSQNSTHLNMTDYSLDLHHDPADQMLIEDQQDIEESKDEGQPILAVQNQSQEKADASIELAFEEIKYDRSSLYDHMLRTDKLRVIEEMDYIKQSFKESTVSQSEHSEGYFPVPIGAVPQP